MTNIDFASRGLWFFVDFEQVIANLRDMANGKCGIIWGHITRGVMLFGWVGGAIGEDFPGSDM